MAQRPHAASPMNEWKWHSLSVQRHDPNTIGFRRAPSSLVSNFPAVMSDQLARSSSESWLLSGCIRMKPIPVADQSVFKKQGRLESYHVRHGEETMYVLRV